MSLLDRARAQREEAEARSRADFEARDARYRGEVAAAASSTLELARDEQIDPKSLICLGRYGHERQLYTFEYEGLKFIAGYYWHGNPGDSFYMAVKVRRQRKPIPWPPPAPLSVRNTGWAPEAYEVVTGLASLASAVDEAKS